MKKLLIAVAMTIALPAAAFAQATPAPAPKAEDHAKMRSMMNCPGMAAMKGHDMSGMKGQDMAGMKGQGMAGMTKQDHDKMMQSCGKAPAKAAGTSSPAQPAHKM